MDLINNIDLRKGNTVSNIDFSKRNMWGIRYRKSDQNLYWIGDEINDEVINLYRLNPNTKELKKLTNVPYIFGWISRNWLHLVGMHPKFLVPKDETVLRIFGA